MCRTLRQAYFTLVYFDVTREAKMAPGRAMAAQERTGYPYNAIWFCNDDLPLAREHENRPVDEAVDERLNARAQIPVGLMVHDHGWCSGV